MRFSPYVAGGLLVAQALGELLLIPMALFVIEGIGPEDIPPTISERTSRARATGASMSVLAVLAAVSFTVAATWIRRTSTSRSVLVVGHLAAAVIVLLFGRVLLSLAFILVAALWLLVAPRSPHEPLSRSHAEQPA